MLRPLFRLLPCLIISGAIIYGFRTLEGPFTIRIVVPSNVKIVTEQSSSAHEPTSESIPVPFIQSKGTSNISLSNTQKEILEAIASLTAYENYGNQIINRKFLRYSRLHPSQRKLVDSIGYKTQFTNAQKSIQANSALTQRIAQHGREEYGLEEYTSNLKEREIDFGVLSEAMEHIVRDWSEYGRVGRDKIYPSILDALSTYFKDVGENYEKKVLVPGFGLGRLAHEIAEINGFSVTANDIDYTGILTYNFIMNQTSHELEHSFYPFCTQWTQQRLASSRFSEVKFPDYIPSSRSRENVRIVGGDFLKEFEDSKEQYDAVVTLFFIDVGENIVDFLERIYSVLKPGGLWINLGPLKWGSHAQVHLSAEEVLLLADKLGFQVNHESRKSIETVYYTLPESLLKYTYVTQFWSAAKIAREGRHSGSEDL